MCPRKDFLCKNLILPNNQSSLGTNFSFKTRQSQCALKPDKKWLKKKSISADCHDAFLTFTTLVTLEIPTVTFQTTANPFIQCANLTQCNNPTWACCQHALIMSWDSYPALTSTKWGEQSTKVSCFSFHPRNLHSRTLLLALAVHLIAKHWKCAPSKTDGIIDTVWTFKQHNPVECVADVAGCIQMILATNFGPLGQDNTVSLRESCSRDQFDVNWWLIATKHHATETFPIRTLR